MMFTYWALTLETSYMNTNGKNGLSEAFPMRIEEQKNVRTRKLSLRVVERRTNI